MAPKLRFSLLIIIVVIATVGTTFAASWFCWFKQNEHVAIWLEGIALVLIFFWDRIDARKTHKETMAQIKIAEQQSQFVVNSERAWVTAALRWAGDKKHIAFLDSPDRVGPTTVVELALELRNDGRTPAWMENISAGMEISGSEQQPEQPVMEYIEPLGAEKSRTIKLTLSCPGKPKMSESETLRVHCTINYRDIFQSREMRLEYQIEPLTKIIRVFGLRKVDFRDSPEAKLRIFPGENSVYMLKPYASMRRGKFVGGHFRFHLRIENRGDRNAAIVRYEVYIGELDRIFTDLKPEEGNHGIESRHGVQALLPDDSLSESSVVRVEADGTTDEGFLAFRIQDLSLEGFASKGLLPQGEEKRFPPLHCRLTLTDMNGASSSAEFTLREE